jgi:uncharacterized protein HemX
MLSFIAAAGDEGSAGVLTLYYLAGSIATILGVAYGIIRYYGRQRDRWQQEGQQRAEQATAMKNNSQKLTENTEAIAALTHKLDDFITTVRSELNGLTHRVTRLEDYRDASDRRDGHL